MKKSSVSFIEIESCQICGSKDISSLYSVKSEYSPDHLQNEYLLFKCSSCDFVFVKSRPDEISIAEYYPETCPNFSESHTTLPERAIKKVKKSQPKENAKKKFLDVGFGPGAELKKRKNDGWDCYGIDNSKFAYNTLTRQERELHLFLGTLEEAKYDSDFFDLINMSHVLEHVHNPLETLAEVNRILKPGGEVVISLPNYLGLYYSLFKNKAEHFSPQHLSFFSPKNLQLALEKTGFDILSVETTIGNNVSYHILHSAGIQKNFYEKSILNQIIGIFVIPFEIIFNKGDVLKIKATKNEFNI